MSEPKYAYRFPPCPDYDVEGMESWLEDMAAKGLVLSTDGFFLGFGSFEKTALRRLKYRLEPMPKQPSFWDDSQDADSKAVELHADFGWEYVTHRGQFFIYATDDPNAPELNTDPQIQALALEMVVKRSRSVFFSSLFSLLITICISLFGKLASMLVFVGPWVAGFFLFAIVWFDFRKIASWLHLRQLKKQLQSGIAMAHRTDYRKRAGRYRLYVLSDTLMGLALIVCVLIVALGSPIGGEKDIPLADFDGALPFAALQDIFPEARIDYEGNPESTVSHWQNLISDNYEYREYADVILEDGTESYAIYYVRYHRTPFPTLAKAMVWEAQLYARQKSDYIPLDISPEGVDYVLAYSNHYPQIAFCKDGTMVETHLNLISVEEHERITQEEFAQIMADSIG